MRRTYVYKVKPIVPTNVAWKLLELIPVDVKLLLTPRLFIFCFRFRLLTSHYLVYGLIWLSVTCLLIKPSWLHLNVLTHWYGSYKSFAIGIMAKEDSSQRGRGKNKTSVGIHGSSAGFILPGDPNQESADFENPALNLQLNGLTRETTGRSEGHVIHCGSLADSSIHTLFGWG